MSFEAKPEKTIATSFEAKPKKIVPVVLRPNHWQTFDLGFEDQPRNFGPLHQVSYSCHDPHRYHLHTTRQANAILHMIQRIKVKLSKCPGFKFKPHQVNDSS
jgi:hypothetical protein